VQRFILFKEFLNVANEEKFTILAGKLFQTFTARSLKNLFLPRVCAAVVNRQLEGVTTAYGMVTIGRQLEIIRHANIY